MDSPKKVLGSLWLAITIPVVGMGIFLAWDINKTVTPQTKVVYQKIVVIPTASPSATVIPTVTIPVKSSSTKAVNTTVKAGDK